MLERYARTTLGLLFFFLTFLWVFPYIALLTVFTSKRFSTDQCCACACFICGGLSWLGCYSMSEAFAKGFLANVERTERQRSAEGKGDVGISDDT